MTPDEFYKTSISSGYACSLTAKKYMQMANRPEYTEDDYIYVYRFHEGYADGYREKWQETHDRDFGRHKTTKRYLEDWED